jgi:DNA-binding MarR family transcriptional regulator
VLTILRHDPELATFDVAARLVEETPGITRLMNTLVAKKYIRRRSAKHDRRQQLCSLTAAGRRAVDAALPPFDDTQVGIISGLSETEARELVRVLHRVAPANVGVPRPSVRED